MIQIIHRFRLKFWSTQTKILEYHDTQNPINEIQKIGTKVYTLYPYYIVTLYLNIQSIYSITLMYYITFVLSPINTVESNILLELKSHQMFLFINKEQRPSTTVDDQPTILRYV